MCRWYLLNIIYLTTDSIQKPIPVKLTYRYNERCNHKYK